MPIHYQFHFDNTFEFNLEALSSVPGQIDIRTTTNGVEKSFSWGNFPALTPDNFVHQYCDPIDKKLADFIMPFVHHPISTCGVFKDKAPQENNRKLLIRIELQKDTLLVNMFIMEDVTRFLLDGRNLQESPTSNVRRIAQAKGILAVNYHPISGSAIKRLKVDIQPFTPEASQSLTGRGGRLGHYFRHYKKAIGLNLFISLLIFIVFTVLITQEILGINVGLGMSIATGGLFSLVALIACVHERNTHKSLFEDNIFPTTPRHHKDPFENYQYTPKKPPSLVISGQALEQLEKDGEISRNTGSRSITTIRTSKAEMSLPHTIDMDEVIHRTPSGSRSQRSGSHDSAIASFMAHRRSLSVAITPPPIKTVNQLLQILGETSWIKDSDFNLSVQNLKKYYREGNPQAARENFQLCKKYIDDHAVDFQVPSAEQEKYKGLGDRLSTIIDLEVFFAPPEENADPASAFTP